MDGLSPLLHGAGADERAGVYGAYRRTIVSMRSFRGRIELNCDGTET